jgi:hypothetical protein
MDVVAMVLISWVIGFHPLLLPTFVVELIPIVDMAPTWTICTAIVVGLRRRRPSFPEPTSATSAPAGEKPALVSSETGGQPPPPLREPKPVQGTDRSTG